MSRSCQPHRRSDEAPPSGLQLPTLSTGRHNTERRILMSSTTIPWPTLPENRLTPAQGNLSGYVFRTAPYDLHDPGPWLWRTSPGYRPDSRTGRHRRGEAPDPCPTSPNTRPRRPSPRPTRATSTPGHTPTTPAPATNHHRKSISTSAPTFVPAPFSDSAFNPDPDRAPDLNIDFGKLREQAWSRFLASSECLAQAHCATRPASLRTRLTRKFRNLIALLSGRTSPSQRRSVPVPGFQ